LHETRVLPAHHLTVVDGIVTTGIARTVFDLAARIHPARLDRLIDHVDVRFHALPKLRAIFPELAKRGRSGTAAMRALLDARGDGYVATESEAEALAVSVLCEYGVREGIRQVNLGSNDRWVGRTDFFYPPERLILEVDSRLAHGGEVATLEDARRRAEYAAMGYRVLPVHYRDIKADPAGFARLVRQALASGGRFWGLDPKIHRQNGSAGLGVEASAGSGVEASAG
jgi:very-short-patch-repair endonuclease